MKKIILLATIILIAGRVSAQTYLTSDRVNISNSMLPLPSVAITASAAMTNATAGTNFNTSGLAGFNAGFAFDLPITSHFSIAPEILYAQKGYTANTQFGNFTQHSQYIDLPVLAKLRAGSQVNFYAGPQLSYFVSQNNSFSSNFTESAQQSFANNGSNLFLQGVVGAGINVSHRVELRARYAIDMSGKYMNGNTSIPSYRNQAIQLGFGFKLGE